MAMSSHFSYIQARKREGESTEIQYCQWILLSWNIEVSGIKSDRMFTKVHIRFLKLSGEGQTWNRWIDIHFLISKYEAFQTVCVRVR